MISKADTMAPTKLQALVERYRRGELTRDAYLEHLRHDYHSVHAQVRTKALALLDDLPEPERTRELIWFADECQWRETRLDIVRALGKKPLQRGLEFLIHLATDDTDLGMCREAIAALGRSQAPLAARYLATCYQSGPEALKPYTAYALGELLDWTLSRQFIDDLQSARRNTQVLWTQSLALALAELNVDACVDTLVDMLRAQPRSVAVSALLALGKLAHQPDILDPYTTDFAGDFVEWQMFTSARQQIELRTRWSIEDYLDKIFDLNTALHPRLVLALNRFAATDVREGLEFFRDDMYRLRLAEMLARLPHPETIGWYGELIVSEDLSDSALTAILKALQYRSDQAFEPLLLQWCDRCLTGSDDGLYDAWLCTCALTLPDGGRILATHVLGEGVLRLSQTRKIILINQLVNHVLSVLRDRSRRRMIAERLEAWVHLETDVHVIGRLLRAMGQIRYASAKLVGFAKRYLQDREVLSSALQFFQHCPQAPALAWLLSILPRVRDDRATSVSLLRAMAAQKGHIAAKRPELDCFLASVLQGTHGKDACLAALAFLTRHPREALFEQLLHLTSTSDQVRIASIVALKSFKKPKATATLAAWLEDAAESIAGRALDSLTAQPDDQARWAILEFLERRIDDMEIVDKVVRSLTPPKRDGKRFVERLNKLIAAHPHHSLIDGLMQLRDRIAPVPGGPQTPSARPSGAAHEFDHELATRLNGFARLDEPVKAALRSAELPYLHPDVFYGDIDKSTSILEYCKAADLFLERYLGGELLFPKLRDNLTAFQNTLYRAGLNEQYPNPALVVEGLSLRGMVAPEVLPLAKMVWLSHLILNGRLQSTPWRYLDGLRAWSAMLLLFVRAQDRDAPSQVAAPIELPGTTDQAIVELALHLDHLQQLRNPVAHRRTLVAFADIEMIRNDMAELFAVLNQLFP
jgi:HEAT repeat protein